MKKVFLIIPALIVLALLGSVVGYYATADSRQLQSAPINLSDYIVTQEVEPFDPDTYQFTVAEPIAVGQFKEAEHNNPHEIYDAEDMQYIAKAPSGSFKLMNDIDMTGVEWTPVDFSGTFDGQNHGIYNLTITGAGSTTYLTRDADMKESPETRFAGLFAMLNGATVKNLKLVGCSMELEPEGDVFAGFLAGCSLESTIDKVTVSGRGTLSAHSGSCGISGLVGYGTVNATGCSIDVTLTYNDRSGDEIINENHMGGVLASGLCYASGCTINIDGYISSHGHVHAGGIVGMHYEMDLPVSLPKGPRNNTVTGMISFYEKCPTRAAYCRGAVGYELFNVRNTNRNDTSGFTVNERRMLTDDELTYQCDAPDFEESIIDHTCTAPGYTEHTCRSCGYSYYDTYTLPCHEPGEWKLTLEPTHTKQGYAEQRCAGCGILMYEGYVDPLPPDPAFSFRVIVMDLEYGQQTVIGLEDTKGLPTEWASTDGRVATVDQSGRVTAAGIGSAVITCTNGTDTAACRVNVSYSTVQRLKLMFLYGWLG